MLYNEFPVHGIDSGGVVQFSVESVLRRSLQFHSRRLSDGLSNIVLRVDEVELLVEKIIERLSTCGAEESYREERSEDRRTREGTGSVERVEHVEQEERFLGCYCPTPPIRHVRFRPFTVNS